MITRRTAAAVLAVVVLAVVGLAVATPAPSSAQSSTSSTSSISSRVSSSVPTPRRAPAPMDSGLAAVAARASSGALGRGAGAEPVRVLIELATPVGVGPDGAAARVTERLADLVPGATAPIDALDRLPIAVTTLSDDDLAAGALDALQADPEVVRLALDRPHEAALTQSVPFVGGDVAHAAERSGAGQVVAVLDTGVEAAHPFLGGAVIAEACFSTDMPAAGVTGFCPGADPTTAVGPGAAAPCSLPGCGHGTHVAGIVAGTDGVAPGASVIAIQVFSRVGTTGGCGGPPPCERYYDADLLRALDLVQARAEAAAGGSGPPIAAVNLSLSGTKAHGPCDSSILRVAIDRLRAVGVATVVAAGNQGDKAALSSPACVSSAIAVGSTAHTADAVSSFSNSDAGLALLAPGESILSSVPGGGQGFRSGTSMAAPHVAGAVAVVRQDHPDWSVSDVVGLLRTTGVPVLDAAADRVTPRLDLGRAVLPPALHPIAPTRVLDTRDGEPLRAGTPLELDMTGAGAGSGSGIVPEGATAVVLNVTGVLPSAGTHLTLVPADGPDPGTSNLNLAAGEVRAALAVVPVGPDGRIRISTATGSTDVVADLAGWYDAGGIAGADDPGATAHTVVAPTRVLDTRDGTGQGADGGDGTPSPLGPGGTASIPIAGAGPGRPCPAGTVAAWVTVTAIHPTADTHLSMVSTTTSAVNVPAGATIPNTALVALDPQGRAAVTNHAGTIEVAVDVQGCEGPLAAAVSPPGSPAGPGRLVVTPPSRVFDTRTGGIGPVAGGTAVAVGVPVPPSGARAAVVTLTAAGATGPTHLSLLDGPDDPVAIALERASVLNPRPGGAVATTVVAPLDAQGRMHVANRSGAIEVIVDLVGWVTD